MIQKLANIETLSIVLILFLHSGCTKDNPTSTDTHAPTVSILFPVNGSEINADTTYTVSADASDNIGVSSVDFYIDGSKVGTSNSSPYQYLWNTPDEAGNHSIMAKASDATGNIASSAVIAVKVKAGVIPQGMVLVAGGTFTAGSTSVTIGGFRIDKYEVTYELWTAVRTWALTHGYTDLVAGQNGYNPVGSNNPVTMVSWYDVVKWCNARSEKDGLTPVYYVGETPAVYRTGEPDINIDAVKWNVNGYRLPTETEWEFAARGGNSTHGYTYSGSNAVDSVAWYGSNSGSTTHMVGQKTANELGIYDMGGNVEEWCWDWNSTTYPSGTTDPNGPSTTQTYNRVVRGGSFNDIDYSCRVDARNHYILIVRNYYIGFRCVQD
jgi:sulfatase modifying factor 1